MIRLFVSLVALFVLALPVSAQNRLTYSPCPNGKCPLQAAPAPKAAAAPCNSCPSGKCPAACPLAGCANGSCQLPSAPVARSAAPACSNGSCSQPVRRGLFGRVRR
jgi:hypothetical protein